MALALLPNLTLNSNPHNPTRHFDLLPPPTSMDSAMSSRPSLPPISRLIEAVNEHSEAVKDRSPNREQSRRISGGSPGNATSPERVSLVGSPRNHQPPTPELPPTSSFDFPRHSPSTNSPTAPPTRSTYNGAGTSSTNPELYAQRTSAYPPIPEQSATYPSVPDASQWTSGQPVRPPTEAAPLERVTRPATTSYAESPVEPAPYPRLSQQRPLPANFPPPLPGQTLPPIDPQMAPTWQHHHYYPPANPPSYPQTQERYVCPTCNKPFSRPSSLKIHTYSHTGEKPYKCKHEGCGKYFSVRSNMKRHEKGCHGGESASAGGNSPKTS